MYMISLIFTSIRKKVTSVMRLFYMHPFISYQRKPPMFKRGEVQYFLARKQDSSDSTHFYQNPGLLLSRFSLVRCTLSMICLAIFVCYLFCSVFSEFPGSVIWYFSLCLESSWPYTFPTIFSSPSDILITCILYFFKLSHSSGMLCYVFPLFLYLHLVWKIVTDLASSSVTLPSAEPIRGILHFC